AASSASRPAGSSTRPAATTATASRSLRTRSRPTPGSSPSAWTRRAPSTASSRPAPRALPTAARSTPSRFRSSVDRASSLEAFGEEMRTMNAALAISLLLATTNLVGQKGNSPPSPAPVAATALAFDVVSIRPSARTDGAYGFPSPPDGYSAMSVPLRKIIESAYSKFDDNLVVGGPSWVDSANFDVEAKFAPADVGAAQKLSPEQRSALLQPVLIDRFHLVVHHETRQIPVFFLTVSKQGAHLEAQTPAAKS